ncbi:hypothetical protein B7P43_G06841 [Cryptotermes secundus]|uniref:HAT C-terminal dimerisation domain-containing protein n=1 Tax=Cryptotermes secundus TaxID=105785 RepID=A0A2J7Q7B4_9NEOP|nr:hypothetical protein B7P43_G06841 [Cryptotermes secundus]
MEIIELQENYHIKDKYKEGNLIEFYKFLNSEQFPNLKKFACKFIFIFGTTYLCEQTFSQMKYIKSKYRANLIQDDEKFLDSVIFSDERTFHVSGKVDTHNCRIWSSENPPVSLEHVRDKAKLNVFCALSKERVYGPFFFIETTITGIVYLDMLQEFLIPQLWGLVKYRVFVPPLSANVVEFRTRITASVAGVTPEMLRSVWQETDYRWDVCRVTNGCHIEP